MSTANPREMDRLLELMADEASEGLDGAGRQELESLLGRTAGVGRDDLMATAALVQLSCLRRSGGSRMPAGLKARLAAQADATLGRGNRTSPPPGPVADIGEARARRQTVAPETAATAGGRGSAPAADSQVPARPGLNLSSLTGWAAAAALAVALVLARPDPATLPAAPLTAEARAALLASAPDAVTLPWSPPTAPGFENVRGDVVWSDSRQEGYLRLAGMPVNNPTEAQYQLWIVDPDRDRHPVDGGVFDVSATGEVIIPIQARLAVDQPKAFAITREQPGGVVVSAGPLLVVAAPG